MRVVALRGRLRSPDDTRRIRWFVDILPTTCQRGLPLLGRRDSIVVGRDWSRWRAWVPRRCAAAGGGVIEATLICRACRGCIVQIRTSIPGSTS